MQWVNGKTSSEKWERKQKKFHEDAEAKEGCLKKPEHVSRLNGNSQRRGGNQR